MQNIYFDNYSDLACDIADKFDMVKDDFGDIAIIAKYEEAKEVITELVCSGYSLVSLDIRRPEWGNYCNEYLISLNNDGIWCEPMKVDNGYLTDESTITYILDNCSSNVIPHCKGKIIFEVGIIDEEECNCDECCCCGCCNCDEDDDYSHEVDYKDNESDNMHGFNVSKSDDNGSYSYSFYSTDKNLVEQIAKMFGR